MSANTSALPSVAFLLYWQVMHQAAVKSTNTGWPAASSASTRPGAQACHADAVPLGALEADGVPVSSMRVTSGPIAPVKPARAVIETIANTVRLVPVRFSDHTTRLRVSSSASKAPAPSTPLKWPRTQTSQTTVASMGKAMKRRRVSIQAPGRGSQLPTTGTHAATRNGSASPSPKAAKIPSACAAGRLIAYPSDAPMKGAVQGEAMATASTPERNASTTGWRACRDASRCGNTLPISNTPARFSPSSVNRVASKATTAGDCS